MQSNFEHEIEPFDRISESGEFDSMLDSEVMNEGNTNIEMYKNILNTTEDKKMIQSMKNKIHTTLHQGRNNLS